MGFEKALRAVKMIKDQIQYRSQSLLNLARGYFSSRKTVKLVIKYVLLYGVTSIMLGLSKRRFPLKVSPNDFIVCREKKPHFEMNTENK